MDNLKYIIFDHPKNGETPIVFPSGIEHFVIAQSVGWDIISAGFLRFEKGDFMYCYGKSQTLKVGSKKIDTQILNVLFR